jgi:hypothetical protein
MPGSKSRRFVRAGPGKLPGQEESGTKVHALEDAIKVSTNCREHRRGALTNLHAVQRYDSMQYLDRRHILAARDRKKP